MNRSLISLLVVGLLMASSVSGGEVSKKFLKKLALHNLMSECWGKQNMKGWYEKIMKSIDKCQKLTPTFDIDIFDKEDGNMGSSPFSLPSQAAGSPSGFDRVNINNPYEAWLAFLAFQQSQQGGNRRFRRDNHKMPSAADLAEFKMNLMDFKEEKIQNLGNLTCVLADMDALDANLQINLRHFTNDIWQKMAEPIDPAFQKRMIESFEDCYSISQSIPQSILDKHPLYKKFGRNKIFFKCQFKAEIDLCAKQQVSKWMEEKYGPVDPMMLKSLGLPEDKFEAAYMKKKVKYMSMPESEKFVWKALFGGKD